VGAHHQNGIAERSIKTILYLARAMLIYSALRWPAKHDIELWPFALDHAVYVWNNLPSNDGFTPIEKWTGVKNVNNNHIRRMHPWGCPAYVLDPKLQDGKKLPKWSPRSRQGKFVGYSKIHASNVGLILNPMTGRISPQYHVLFDDFFTTVRSVDDTRDPVFEDIDWNRMIQLLGTDTYFEEADVDYVPPVSAEWESREERDARVQREQPTQGQPVQREESLPQREPPQRAPAAPPASPGTAAPPPLQREIIDVESEPTPIKVEESTRTSVPSSEIDRSNIVAGKRARKPPRRFSPESLSFVQAQTPDPPFPGPVVLEPSTDTALPTALFSQSRAHNASNSDQAHFYTATASHNKLNKKLTGNDVLNQRLQTLDWSS
jgi:hypothetical protein